MADIINSDLIIRVTLSLIAVGVGSRFLLPTLIQDVFICSINSQLPNGNKNVWVVMLLFSCLIAVKLTKIILSTWFNMVIEIFK